MKIMSSLIKPKAKNFYPLSPMQEGMLFHTLYAPGSGVYVEQVCYKLQGEVDTSAFESAWQAAAKRHQVLRTCFVWEDVKNPVQWVRDEARIPIDQVDLRNRSEKEQEEWLNVFLNADREKGFELAEAPLTRLTLLRLAGDRYGLVWTWHHILMDAWSSSLVTQEVFAFYKAFSNGKKLNLKESRPYRDYIAWLHKQDRAKAEAYWRRHLNGFDAPTPLITDRSAASSSDEKRHDDVYVQMPAAATEGLQVFARRHRLTLNTVFQAAWALLLSRYSGERNVVFGSVVSGRPVDINGVESMVGLFINTLPVRVDVDPDAEIASLLKRLQAGQVEARSFEYTPLVDIQGWTAVPRNLPLFETILIFENVHYEKVSVDQSADDERLAVNKVILYEQINYPLSLTVVPSSGLLLQIMFDSLRFCAATVRRMLAHLQRLFDGMVAVPQGRVGSLTLMTEGETTQLLAEWNDSARDYDRDSLMHDLVEAQARRSPDRVALVFEGRQVTYCELDRRSNLLARRLHGLRIGPEKLVAVYMNRSAEMVIGLLAILKTGAAYVPVDPEFPEQRVEYIFEDSGICAVLTEQDVATRLPRNAARAVCADAEETIASLGSETARPNGTADNLAYVIYTSGSTGNPKGVQVSHRGVVNFIESMRNEPGLLESDVLLAVTTLSFDIAALEIFLPLTLGARLAIIPSASEGVPLIGALTDYDATVLQATPATYRLLIDAGWEAGKRMKLLCGGEALPRELAERLREMGGELWNMYGPTETTIWSATDKVESGSGPVPLGRPIANTRIHLLDRDARPVPIGVPGEVFIGGDGVARGYIGRPELTAERMVPDPFSDRSGGRLYRTGDLARYLDNGKIEFIGRLDFQLKVRGFRIEAGEVEAALARHPAVRQCAVVARGGASGDKELAAYVVYDGDQPRASELRKFLGQRLPEYMCPSRFEAVEQMPLTPNGKVDRRALLSSAATFGDRQSSYVAPRSLLEHRLAAIWEEVFNMRPVGVTDNFFELGGHSLLAVRVIAQIHRQLGQRLPLATLLAEGTIENLAAALRRSDPAVESPLVAIQTKGSRRPMFFVHPIGGQVMVYYRLARQMGEDQPFYALQAPEVFEVGAEYASIEEMAADYLEAVRAIQAEGPYVLGGYSFGGYVAFEMAQLLVRRGEQTSMLAILDTWSPALYQSFPEDDDDAVLLALLARMRAREEGKSLVLSPEEIRRLGPAERLSYVFEEAKKAKILDENITDDIGIPYVRSYLTGYKTRQRAIFRYRPQVYPGRISLFRCVEEDQETLKALKKFGADTSDPSFGWAALSEEPVDLHMVPGYHERMLEEPYVKELAERIKMCAGSRPPAVLTACEPV